MFVRWKKVRLARGGELHFEHDEGVSTAGCNHPHGPDSVRLTPIVVESYRPKGKAPKHRIVWRPGLSIRQCCVVERETIDRLSFWARVEQGWREHAKTLAGQRERGEISAEVEKDFRNARELVFAQIGRVVPRWTQEERDLYRFCFFGFGHIRHHGESELDTERRVFRDAVARRDEWYANRRNGETFPEWWKRKHERPREAPANQQNNGMPGGVIWFALEVNSAPCWDVLGIRWPVTAEQVAKAYKALALKHHPDRGGHAADFRRATSAKDQALAFIGRFEALTGRKAS